MAETVEPFKQNRSSPTQTTSRVSRDSSGPVAKTPSFPMQLAQIQSLVRELAILLATTKDPSYRQ